MRPDPCLWQERTRKLSSEVTALRRQLSERDQQLHDAEAHLRKAQADLQHRLHLIAKLEEDLSSVRSGGPAAAMAGSTAGSSGALSGLVAGVAEGASLGGTLGPGEGAAAADGGSAAAGASSLLDIVVSQRDRFRQRMVQLEEEKGGPWGRRGWAAGKHGRCTRRQPRLLLPPAGPCTWLPHVELVAPAPHSNMSRGARTQCRTLYRYTHLPIVYECMRPSLPSPGRRPTG